MHKLKLMTIVSGCVVVLLLVAESCAGEKERLFSEGNRFYQEGNYAAALEAYEKILAMGYESGAIHYNMGNCYYKLQDIGRAILSYERAKKLMPADEDLRANLALANLAVVDQINPRTQFILFRMIRGFTHLLPKHILVWIVLGLYVGFVGFLTIWVVSRKRIFRLIGSRGGVFWGILLFVFGLALVGRLQEDKNTVEGVILVDKVDVMSAPSEGVEMFSLHEGTKVRIDQRSGEWMEIILADGKVGWVRQEVLEII